MSKGCTAKPRFEGWYLKHQNESETIALIPSIHTNKRGEGSASLQIITEKGSYQVSYSPNTFQASRSRFFVRVGRCVFSERGCRLHCQTPDLHLEGILRYGGFLPPQYDAMGPFRFVPFLQCRHHVLSLRHRVDGKVQLNGRDFVFHNGVGYVEGDSGVSFPRRYLWTQCGWDGNSVMLSIADVPICGREFPGCIAIVHWKGQEYRLATYRGVRILHAGKHGALIRQGEYSLLVQLLEANAQILRAPLQGGLERAIRESAACRVRFRFMRMREVLFDAVSPMASYECEWEDSNE